MPLGGDRFHVANGEILQLLLHRVVQLLFRAAGSAAYCHRMRGANGRGRRHRRDAGGNGNETARTGRSRSRRRDIDYHRHRRSQKTLYDRLRRIEQAARGVELNDEALRVLPARFLDASRNVTRRCRANSSIDFDEGNLLRHPDSFRGSRAHQRESQAYQRSFHPHLLMQTITSPSDLQPRNNTSLGGHAFNLKEEPDSNPGEHKIFL